MSWLQDTKNWISSLGKVSAGAKAAAAALKAEADALQAVKDAEARVRNLASLRSATPAAKAAADAEVVAAKAALDALKVPVAAPASGAVMSGSGSSRSVAGSISHAASIATVTGSAAGVWLYSDYKAEENEFNSPTDPKAKAERQRLIERQAVTKKAEDQTVKAVEDLVTRPITKTIEREKIAMNAPPAAPAATPPATSSSTASPTVVKPGAVVKDLGVEERSRFKARVRAVETNSAATGAGNMALIYNAEEMPQADPVRADAQFFAVGNGSKTPLGHKVDRFNYIVADPASVPAAAGSTHVCAEFTNRTNGSVSKDNFDLTGALAARPAATTAATSAPAATPAAKAPAAPAARPPC